jgi:hypothetical protein
MFFGVFDYITLTVILIFSFTVWKYKIMIPSNWIFYLIAFLIFGIIIPFASIHYEVQKAVKDQPFTDSFTLLYTFFRFPVWWLIGLLEVLWLRFNLK